MSTQLSDKLKFEILQWLQETYAGKQLNFFLDEKFQWMVSSYFKGGTILCLQFVRGRKEARIRPQNFVYEIDVSDIKTLTQFKGKFIKLTLKK